jgi:hypothetical protein
MPLAQSLAMVEFFRQHPIFTSPLKKKAKNPQKILLPAEPWRHAAVTPLKPQAEAKPQQQHRSHNGLPPSKKTRFDL